MSAKLKHVGYSPSKTSVGSVLLASVVVAGGLFAGCDKKADLSNDKGKASYAIGLQIGNSLRQQNADVDTDSLAAGLRDGVSKAEPKLKPEEQQAAMNKMNEVAQKKATEAAETNQKAGAEWLEKNKSKPNVKTTASGLQYEVIQDGAGAVPKDGDVVKVHYTGALTTGEKFDSSVDRGQPVDIPVNGVIPGWTEALKMMKVGSKYKLYIPANLAYGPQARPGIPANSVLVFDVELLDTKAGTPPAPPAAPAAEGAKGKGKKK